jgi:hypothetical protein
LPGAKWRCSAYYRLPVPRCLSPVACFPFPGLPAIASGFAKATPDESGEGGFPFPDVAFSQQVIHNGVWPSVHVTNHQIRVKIDQKGDVFRQKGIKKARVSSCPS